MTRAFESSRKPRGGRGPAAAFCALGLLVALAGCGGGGGGDGGGAAPAGTPAPVAGTDTTGAVLPGEATASTSSMMGWMRTLTKSADDTGRPYAIGASRLPIDDTGAPADI